MLANFTKIYLAKIKTYSIVLSILFIVSIVIGYDLAREYPEKTKEIIYDILKDLIDPTKEYSSFQLLEFIFIKNLTVATISVLLGIIFGIIPVAIIFLNGLIFGIVAYIALEQFNMLVFLAGILPHGIIEIPALIFSAAGGLLIWQSLWDYILYNKGEPGKNFILTIKFFIFVVMPMLAVAAIIETFITPYILDSAVKLS